MIQWLHRVIQWYIKGNIVLNSYRQQIIIQQLTDERNSLQERLKTADDTLERQMKQIENLTLQLGEAERSLAEKEEDMESLNKTSKDEV